MFPDPASPDELGAAAAVIDAWLASQVEENPAVDGMEQVVADRQWFVRLRGEEKSTFSVLLMLDQRTLRYESYLMPAPQENQEDLYAHLLGRNRDLYGVALMIGDEGAVYLAGGLDVRSVDEHELDRVLGTLYVCTERFFRPAMRIGFASVFDT